MRLKHSIKKHRLVSLDSQRIIDQNLQKQQTGEQNNKQLSSILSPQENTSHYKLNSIQNAEKSIKSNTKECKIRDLIFTKKYSPTNSDIEYLHSIDNYKLYLKKTQNKNLENKKPDKFEVKGRSNFYQAPQVQGNNIKIKDQMGNYRNNRQQKIQKVQDLNLKYDSVRQIQTVYENIYKANIQNTQKKTPQNFSLISVQQYLQSVKKADSSNRNSNYFRKLKIIKQKAYKKPTKIQIKLSNRNSFQTQRTIDPLSLIQMINLNQYKQDKSKQPNSDLNFISQKKREKQSFIKNHDFYISNQEKSQILSKRPSTAPNKKFKQKSAILSQKMSQKVDNQKYFGLQNGFEQRNQQNNSNQLRNILPIKEFDLKKKVKGIRHVERQKYSWKDFRKQSQQMSSNKNIRPNSAHVFVYPWNNWTKPSLNIKELLN